LTLGLKLASFVTKIFKKTRTSYGAVGHIKETILTWMTFGGAVERKERTTMVARNKSISKRKMKKTKKKIY
jgi:hypothetical protein